ncbi:MAG: sigma-54-dependent transcriptional regulator [Pyrinomonadaceae bacterium]
MEKSHRKALIIEDDKTALELFSFQLSSEGFDVSSATSSKDGLELIGNNDFDVVLTDLNLPDINGIELVRMAREIAPHTEIIVVTGDDSAERAIEATRVGAFGYIVKPVDFDELMVDIRNAVERKRQSEENRRQAVEIETLRGRLSGADSFEGIVGRSRQMKSIFELIENVADSEANILILGESGTGKEVIANAIHQRSSRSKKPYVKVNCSALPKELIESQLFGHVKGAFTGANTDKTGFIGQANGGSLLLDEIAEMPIDLQPKLLRVLQEKSYQPVGSEKTSEADFRLICSTNLDPFEAISAGSLREDLFYRINTIEIRLPPLRERMEDVPILAEHFLRIFAEKYDRPDAGISKNIYDQMMRYHWRGNVRELQNTIERALLLSKDGKIESLHLTLDADSSLPESKTPASYTFDADENAMRSNESSVFDLTGRMIIEELPDVGDERAEQDVFELVEKSITVAALRRTSGNKQSAANLLGIYRPRLYGILKRHKIDKVEG